LRKEAIAVNVGVFGIQKKRTANKDRPAGARNHHLRAERKRRQVEAEARNKKWAAIPPHQQLKSLDDREMAAVKQRRKILARIDDDGKHSSTNGTKVEQLKERRANT